MPNPVFRLFKQTVKSLPSLLVLAVSSLLVVGCVSIPPRGQVEYGSAEHRARMQDFTHWQVRAKVASNQGASGGRAKWLQQGEQFDIRIAGPLGIGAVELSGTPDQITVSTRDGDIVTDNPEATMRQLLGWSLPPANARYWLVGVPGPERQAKALYNQRGLLIRLEQGDWVIDYPEYQVMGRYELPRKINMTRGDLQLRLVLADWREA